LLRRYWFYEESIEACLCGLAPIFRLAITGKRDEADAVTEMLPNSAGYLVAIKFG
jgi:hypothetical protein